MDLQFNDEDIKKHLHDLGYRNIPEGKLQTFVTDLRRLVKYEERKKLLDRKLDDLENVQPSPKLTERRRRPSSRRRKADENLSRISQEPVSSSSDPPNHSFISNDMTSSSTVHSRDESSLYIDIKIPRSVSTQSLPLAASVLENRTGVIKSKSTAALGAGKGRRGRADPVSLHQEYKKAWSKLNLPGETSHRKLRWAVRGWMMGEEPL